MTVATYSATAPAGHASCYVFPRSGSIGQVKMRRHESSSFNPHLFLLTSDTYQAYTLVYFHPKAYTGGCTAQGCSLRGSYDALTRKGVAVIGVSIDTVEDQKGFKELNHFQFPLISDIDKKVATAFGVPNANVAQRSAYLIKDGKIIYADYKGTTDKQAEVILQVIADLEKK
jgi:peroxiredoxin Q/BCP